MTDYIRRLGFVRAFVLSSALASLSLLTTSSPALAYGSTDQWQIGFAGTFTTPSGELAGFWGWCAFGGSDGSSAIGTTGKTADCQSSNYFPFLETGPGNQLNPIKISEDITGWKIETSAPPPKGTGLNDFFVTSGTAVLNGPGAAVLGIPAGVPIQICPFTPLCGDSGFPAMPGHFNRTGPGFEIQIQITEVPQ
jgi:hypothetical protein